jgi:hypothetical protein
MGAQQNWKKNPGNSCGKTGNIARVCDRQDFKEFSDQEDEGLAKIESEEDTVKV